MVTEMDIGRSRISGKLGSFLVGVFLSGNITLIFSKGTLLTGHHVLHTPIICTKSTEALLYGHMEMDFTVCVKHRVSVVRIL